MKYSGGGGIEKGSIEDYVDKVKKGKIKITDVPLDLRDKVKMKLNMEG